MNPRREHSKDGWLILSAGRAWDDWVYPTEQAARLTAEKCEVPKAEVIKGKRNRVRLLADRKWRS